ncbi:hypothetical protein AB0J57_00400 [Streptomyces sp. NPDC049837]|uniref:hypothetical protein n=1 Tax=Streptomyces sp. NPDC049837 TaxID=3155277 RepID=UPI0034219F41
MAVARRLSRFVEWPDLCDSGTVGGDRTFFTGTNVATRMAQLRRAIHEIRTNWDRYPVYMAELGKHMERDLSRAAEPLPDQDRELIHALLSSVKEWADRRPSPGENVDEYSAIRLYTSEPGYRRIFSTINTAFRRDGLVDDPKGLRSAAFLVELLSIDLFNYRYHHPHVDNFEGVVHRGMCVTERQLAELARIAAGPVSSRYLSIPLGMASASVDRDRAMAFAREQARRNPDLIPLIWKIQVCGLTGDQLEMYRSHFPLSTVTSVCAVPIDELSEYAYEREVLLRGPFFQLLRLTEDMDGVGTGNGRAHTIEAIMLNSNRDHVSTVASDEGEDRRARDMFRSLVTVRRATWCERYAHDHGMSEDAAAYRRLLVEAMTALEAQLGHA